VLSATWHLNVDFCSVTNAVFVVRIDVRVFRACYCVEFFVNFLTLLAATVGAICDACNVG
jgi:hypothetical protein